MSWAVITGSGHCAAVVGGAWTLTIIALAGGVLIERTGSTLGAGLDGPTSRILAPTMDAYGFVLLITFRLGTGEETEREVAGRGRSGRIPLPRLRRAGGGARN